MSLNPQQTMLQMEPMPQYQSMSQFNQPMPQFNQPMPQFNQPQFRQPMARMPQLQHFRPALLTQMQLKICKMKPQILKV